MKTSTWADVALGVWLLAAPLLLGYSALRPIVVVEDLVPGLFLVATSLWILFSRASRLRITWLQALGGLWVLAGSIVLTFGNLPRAAANAAIIGLAIMLVNLAGLWAFTRNPNALSNPQ